MTEAEVQTGATWDIRAIVPAKAKGPPPGAPSVSLATNDQSQCSSSAVPATPSGPALSQSWLPASSWPPTMMAPQAFP